MKWSYTDGKLNVSSEEVEQQFLLKELIEEASRHQAYQKRFYTICNYISGFIFPSKLWRRNTVRCFSLFLRRLLCYTFNIIWNNLINCLCINEEASKESPQLAQTI
ncbi:MAG: hypothetical protein CM15mP86_02030 [Gammaproteobacteria bacterium]|nr:MAG: hypothetical protein CM15mP86_02030 [Gammaproteobacteria bacterium]